MGIVDELRGSADGSNFKSYVPRMMFYRYISKNLTSYINDVEAEAGRKEQNFMWGAIPLYAPGSNQKVSTESSMECLKKVVNYITR